MAEPIYVTRPFLPPLEELMPYLEKIWQNRILTNGGPLHQELEKRLAEYLDVPHISLFANGTIALVTALQALDIRGEVITTPYSFVATAHSLLWNRLTPVFVDIDPVTLNLDPARIAEAVTEKTTAIMPVHCYGIPCSVDEIDEIARRADLKVIYDAAHAFGVRMQNRNLLKAGDLSVLSFHATKVYNTFEGGAIISATPEMKQHIDHLKNFGFVDETVVIEAGINGKMNELQAALGLLQLRHVEDALERRATLAHRYRQLLSGIPGIRCHVHQPDLRSNNAYFPIFIENEYPRTRDELYVSLKERGIHTRRYFYPLISTFDMYRHLPSARAENLPIASDMAERVLCLPIYPDLTDEQVDTIVALIATP